MKNGIIKFCLSSLLLILFSIFFVGCENTNNSQELVGSNEIFMNEVGCFENGVSFEIYECKEEYEISNGFYNYTTDDKFLVIGLRVYNGSKEVFEADATDVWIAYNDAKINQQNIVKRYSNGYNAISQSVTVTKDYYLIFEIGKNIPIQDLKLIIHNGKVLKSESLIIKLENAPKDCQITLDYSYDGKIENYKYYAGTTLTASNLPVPYRVGYKFIGWYFNEDYSGEVLTSIILEKNQDICLYAKWKAKNYINYNYQYDSKVDKFYLEDEEILTLLIPERLGYTFDGWYNTPLFEGDAITEISLLTESIELYAKWIENSVYLIYDGNGSTSGKMENQLFRVGETLVLNENKFVRDGYTFMGWSFEKTSNEFIEDTSEYTMLPTNYESIKIYARWSKEIRTVEDFNAINSNNAEYYTLLNDIDFENKKATTIKEFYGVFEGGGYTLKNSNQGLFTSNKGIIKNLIIENCAYAQDNQYIGGFLVFNSGTILNCGIITNLKVDESVKEFGGFCATNLGNIENSYAKINATVAVWGGYVGGFVGSTGRSENSISNISNCYAQGELIVKNDYNGYAGGFVGAVSDGKIQYCYSNIHIYSNAESTGGFVGVQFSSCMIRNCFVLGQMDVEYGTRGGFSGTYLSMCTLENIFRSDTNLFSEGTVCNEGKLIQHQEFYSKEFYIKNNLLEVYVDEATLQENENTVWIIEDGELPKLYWE